MIPHSSSSFLFTDAPRVELALGASISPESIYEGGDVYFDCRIDAQPPPRRIAWKFNVRAQFLFFLKKIKGNFWEIPACFGSHVFYYEIVPGALGTTSPLPLPLYYELLHHVFRHSVWFFSPLDRTKNSLPRTTQKWKGTNEREGRVLALL